jgi:hypothetical protein
VAQARPGVLGQRPTSVAILDGEVVATALDALATALEAPVQHGDDQKSLLMTTN